MSLKISQLVPRVGLTGAEDIPCQLDGENFKIKVSDVVALSGSPFADDITVNGVRVGGGGTDSGLNNTLLGVSTLSGNTTGAYNIAVGPLSLSLNTTGSNNIAIGSAAAAAITTGNNNTIIGQYQGTETLSDTVVLTAGSTERLKVDASGMYINGVMLDAGGGGGGSPFATDILVNGLTVGQGAFSPEFATNNTALGSNALLTNTSGSNNVALGYSALRANTTGGSNVAVGYNALKSSTVVRDSIAIGKDALSNASTSGFSIAIGSNAMRYAVNGYSMAIGYNALGEQTTGDTNIAIGHTAGQYLTTGSNNIFIGKEAGINVGTGTGNTIIGQYYGATALSSTVLLAAGSTERLKVDASGMYVNGVKAGRVVIPIICSDETTALTAGEGKMSFIWPFGFTLSAVHASLKTAQASGAIFTVDVNVNGTSILSTKLTIDNTEKTSNTALAPAVVLGGTVAYTAFTEFTVDIDQIGTSGAAGLKLYLIGS